MAPEERAQKLREVHNLSVEVWAAIEDEIRAAMSEVRDQCARIVESFPNHMKGWSQSPDGEVREYNDIAEAIRSFYHLPDRPFSGYRTTEKSDDPLQGHASSSSRSQLSESAGHNLIMAVDYLGKNKATCNCGRPIDSKRFYLKGQKILCSKECFDVTNG